MFRKLKSVVVFLKIIVSFVLTRPFGKNSIACKTGTPITRTHNHQEFVRMIPVAVSRVKPGQLTQCQSNGPLIK